MATLDRFFCTTDFDQIFPLATVQALPRVGGDHTPVLWDSGCATPPKASSYKMEKWWLLRADFSELI